MGVANMLFFFCNNIRFSNYIKLYRRCSVYTTSLVLYIYIYINKDSSMHTLYQFLMIVQIIGCICFCNHSHISYIFITSQPQCTWHRSRAQVNPPSVAVQTSWPTGGSPLRARRLTIPASLQVTRAASMVALSTFVQVMCMLGLAPYSVFAFLQRSMVSSLVLPPAPQVISTKRGIGLGDSDLGTRVSLERTLKRESIPTSVLLISFRVQCG